MALAVADDHAVGRSSFSSEEILIALDILVNRMLERLSTDPPESWDLVVHPPKKAG